VAPHGSTSCWLRRSTPLSGQGMDKAGGGEVEISREEIRERLMKSLIVSDEERQAMSQLEQGTQVVIHFMLPKDKHSSKP